MLARSSTLFVGKVDSELHCFPRIRCANDNPDREQELFERVVERELSGLDPEE